MSNNAPRPTIDELFETLKRTSLPTVLVEGVDDIIFYRKIEDDLAELGLDVLPAGNKDAVLKLREKLKDFSHVSFVFVVDKDLWIHGIPPEYVGADRLVITEGYSVENDLFEDGNLEALMSNKEKSEFDNEIEVFVDWYALAVDRNLKATTSTFRTHPGKVLDDRDFYHNDTKLLPQEVYPSALRDEIKENYKKMVRGKSLISILHRQLSKKKREVKYSTRQLIDFGGSRKGSNFTRIRDQIHSIMAT